MSSTARSCGSTRTRSWSTSATSPRASSPRTSSRSASRSIPADEVELGEEVDALVLTKEDQEGRLILSKKRARFEKAWRRIETGRGLRRAGRGHRDRGRQGRPDPRPRRARLPARLPRRHPPRPEPRRVHGPEARVQGDRAQPLPQQRRALPPRGARGGAQGGPRADPRPTSSRARWSRARSRTSSTSAPSSTSRDRRPDPHLRALLESRQPPVRGPSRSATTVRVKVLDIDRDRQRISLGLKQTQEDPWQRVVNEHKLGDVARGHGHQGRRLRRLRRDPARVEGLVHISELADHHVESPAEVVGPETSSRSRSSRSTSAPPLAQRQAGGGTDMPMQNLAPIAKASSPTRRSPPAPAMEDDSWSFSRLAVSHAHRGRASRRTPPRLWPTRLAEGPLMSWQPQQVTRAPRPLRSGRRAALGGGAAAAVRLRTLARRRKSRSWNDQVARRWRPCRRQQKRTSSRRW